MKGIYQEQKEKHTFMKSRSSSRRRSHRGTDKMRCVSVGFNDMSVGYAGVGDRYYHSM